MARWAEIEHRLQSWAEIEHALESLQNDYDNWARRVEQAERDEEAAHNEPDARLREDLLRDVEQLWDLINDNRENLFERCEDLMEDYEYMDRDQQGQLDLIYEGVRG